MLPEEEFTRLARKAHRLAGQHLRRGQSDTTKYAKCLLAIRWALEKLSKSNRWDLGIKEFEISFRMIDMVTKGEL